MGDTLRDPDDAAWQRFVKAEHDMVVARMALVATDWEPVVRQALSPDSGDKETALRLLQLLPDDRTVPFARDLLPLALHSKPYVAIVRERLASLGPGWISAHARPFVTATISAPDATEEDFHLLAHLLQELGESELLAMVLEAARASEDPDIREVVEYYGGSTDIDDDVRVWLDPVGGITIKAVTREGDPVELSSTQARSLAEAIIELAERDDA